MTNVAAFPADVAIATINFCTARCTFCPLYQGSSPIDRTMYPPTEMPREMFEKILEEICGWEHLPLEIHLGGLSDHLDPKALERLSAIKRLGLGDRTRFPSNAQVLPNEVALAIVDAGIDQVKVGWDGAASETYEPERVGWDFERAVGNVRNLAAVRDKAKSKTRIIVKFVRTMRNDREIVAAYELLGKFLDHALDRFEDSLAFDWGDKPADNAGTYYLKRAGGRPRLSHCWHFEPSVVVHPDGRVAACWLDYNLGVSGGGFGNVAEDTLLNIWRGQKRNALKLAFLTNKGVPEKCQSCFVLHKADPIPASLMRLDEGRLDLRLPTGGIYRFS